MRSSWRAGSLVALVMSLGQAWILWLDRANWRGHGPMFARAFVGASYWPGIVLGGIGAFLVCRAELSGLDDYVQTSALTRSRVALCDSIRLSVPTIAGSTIVLLTGFIILVKDSVFGSPRPWILIVALLWIQFGLILGICISLMLPDALRKSSLVLAPLLCYVIVYASASSTGGAIGTLGMAGIHISVDSIEPLVSSILRCLVWACATLLLGALAWLPRLRWLPALGLAVSIAISVSLLPRPNVATSGANELTCHQLGRPNQVEVCTPQWAQASQPIFTQTIGDLLTQTPMALRPQRVVVSPLAGGSSLEEFSVGYPAGDSYVATWVDPELLERSYVQQLVQACGTSPTSSIFTMRGYQAFGIDPEHRIRRWEPTLAELRSRLDPASTRLVDLLFRLTDQEFFAELRLRQTEPAWCAAPATDWLARIG